MITQAIKDWLNKMFAWWPWRRSPDNTYTQPVGMNKGLSQEGVVWAPIDGPAPSPGFTSVVVEQGRAIITPDPGRLSADERSDSAVPVPPDDALRSNAGPDEEKQPGISHNVNETPAPTMEQQLEFLRYLVQRGIVNEGFSADQLPRQYKKFW